MHPPRDTPMRPIDQPQRHTRQPMMLALLTFFVAALSGCGHDSANAQPAGTSAVAATDATAADPGTSPNATAKADWDLIPLTQADVQLYLGVMRAAAARLRHPSATDLAAPRLAKAAELKMQQGHPEQITNAEIEAIDLAGTLQGYADNLVVASRHIDAERYSHVVDRVEDAVVPPQFDFQADGDNDMGTHYVPTAHDRAVEATRNANIKLLAPHRSEILALQAVVRDMTPRDGSQ